MSTSDNNEMTLRELIMKIHEYSAFFWKNALWICLIIFAFMALFGVNSFLSETQYNGRLTFMINEDEGSSIGGLGSVLGQFGLGGGGRGGNYNLEKVIELAKSRRIIQSVLFTKTEMPETGEDYLANHLIRNYDLHEAWIDDLDLQGFLFTTDSVPAFNRPARKALMQLHGLLIGNDDRVGLININIGEGTGILTINAGTVSEEISLEIPVLLYDQLSKFYVEKTTEKQRSTFEAVSVKADSIRQALRSAEYNLAKVADRSGNVSMLKDRLQQTRLRQEIGLLQIMYGEAVKNLETSRFMLQSVTPFFQLIDMPMSPLQPKKKGFIKKMILGGVLGGILAVLLFGSIKLYRDTLSE